MQTAGKPISLSSLLLLLYVTDVTGVNCTAGSYAASATSTVCTVCPPNSNSVANAQRCTANAGYAGPTILFPFLTDTGNAGSGAASPTSVGSPAVQSNVCDSLSSCRAAAYFPNAGDATASNYIKVANTYPGPLTVSYWSKTALPSTAATCALSLDNGGTTANTGFDAIDNPINPPTDGVSLRAYLGSWGCGKFSYYQALGTDAYNAAVGANIWHHVTHTIQPKGTGYTMTSYMNGVPWIDGFYSCSGNLLGYTNFNVGSCNTVRNGLKGWISDVRLYQFALSAAQVQSIYESGNSATPTTFMACPGSCPAGQTLHCRSDGVGVCCGAGTSYADGLSTSTVCTACPAGRYSQSGATCDNCAPGFYCPSTSMSSQNPCPSGSYCPSAGMSAVITCPAGSYCPIGSSAQILCPAGTYSSAPGQSSVDTCTQCATGFYSPTPGATSASTCVPCGAGPY